MLLETKPLKLLYKAKNSWLYRQMYQWALKKMAAQKKNWFPIISIKKMHIFPRRRANPFATTVI